MNKLSDVLIQDSIKTGRYTGKMKPKDHQVADRKFLQGDTTVLVTTEAFELGVDNPNITQVFRIGCPRNLGVLLQKVGRAGRKPNSIAKGVMYFNEVIDDKRLGLWLQSALKSKDKDIGTEIDKKRSEMIHAYIQVWKFIYSVYDGKCLSKELSVLYGGAGDDLPTCFVANSPLFSVCSHSEEICQWNVDIEPFLIVLLSAFKQMHDLGLQNVTKTCVASNQ